MASGVVCAFPHIQRSHQIPASLLPLQKQTRPSLCALSLWSLPAYVFLLETCSKCWQLHCRYSRVLLCSRPGGAVNPVGLKEEHSLEKANVKFSVVRWIWRCKKNMECWCYTISGGLTGLRSLGSWDQTPVHLWWPPAVPRIVGGQRLGSLKHVVTCKKNSEEKSEFLNTLPAKTMIMRRLCLTVCKIHRKCIFNIFLKFQRKKIR